jgi:hypothetical protein
VRPSKIEDLFDNIIRLLVVAFILAALWKGCVA